VRPTYTIVRLTGAELVLSAGGGKKEHAFIRWK
jgi:hypothetical protein